jgi:alcohol dehydrogenase
MQAVVYHEFGGPIAIETVTDPSPHADGAVVRVDATGLCRSDWHGWRGHDPDIKRFPHVPGHEFAGTVVAVGRDVPQSLVGQRVTMPFVAGCGNCSECKRGQQQICDHQFQPGFTGWGSFAEYVAVRYAISNLVPLSANLSSAAAAAMGCRLGTAFRALSAQGGVRPGNWVAVHGCGGVRLSAVMIARALEARVIAVDIRPEPLTLAKQLGAEFTLNASTDTDVVTVIRDRTSGGVDVSIDALGSAATLTNSVLSLRKQGRHVQVGLLAEDTTLPASIISRIIAWELEIVGSHGIQARTYVKMFDLIQAGKFDPMQLVERTLPLDTAPHELESLNDYRSCGVTVFTRNISPHRSGSAC